MTYENIDFDALTDRCEAYLLMFGREAYEQLHGTVESRTPEKSGWIPLQEAEAILNERMGKGVRKELLKSVRQMKAYQGGNKRNSCIVYWEEDIRALVESRRNRVKEPLLFWPKGE